MTAGSAPAGSGPVPDAHTPPARERDAEPVRADYGGACVASIVPAILRGEHPGWLPDAVRDARVVVLLVLDGLGWSDLRANADRMPVLSAMEGGPITTVVPSTTAAALTSITTGLAPSVHGVVGFRVALDGDVLNVLGFQLARGKRPPDPFTVQRHPAFLGRQAVVVSGAAFRDSGFTRVHMRDARFVGYRTESTLVEHLRRLARGADPFVYAYYPGIDEVAHAYGLHDGYHAAELAAADRLVGDILDALPGDAALVVTADHGQSHVGREGWRPLGDVGDLVATASGDGRFRYLHARRGAAGELVDAARGAFGPLAWVLTREELLGGGWLGPTPSAATRRRVGDVVLAAHAGVAFVDPDLPREARLVSAHGSLTAAEMWVPCIAARGSARRPVIG
ncbi:MAG: phosphodiesterase [Acidimicrobiia bacterium]